MPAGPIDKVIVTNLARLAEKYKAPGVTAIRTAVKNLIAADAKRGLKTVLIDLSSKSAMKQYKAAPVPAADAGDPRANKEAIDRVFTSVNPSYLMILGAPDVIPHQDLKNPVFSDQDTDEFALSDLPYACDAPYSTNINKFLAPTRVVGRLPDLTNSNDPTYLVRLLGIAANYVERPAKDYDAFLGITTETWQSSTDESLRAIFGSAAGMKIVPPTGPPWSAADLGARAHFINCHGAAGFHQFFGEPGDPLPVSHDATQLPGHIADGTILSAECCYGGDLYDPAIDGGQMGICQTYLGNGAYACFVSSTIAYGPPSGNDQADLLCQDFLKHVRAGASVGRACLQARLDYVARAVVMGGVDLKTIAQFGLMGDPSLTPVKSMQPVPHVIPKGTKAKSAGALAPALAAVARAARVSRRATICEVARSIIASTLVVAETAVKVANKVPKNLESVASQFGLEKANVVSMPVLRGAAAKGLGGMVTKALSLGGAPSPTAVHTLMERRETTSRAILIKGVEVIDYNGTYEAREFRSR